MHRLSAASQEDKKQIILVRNFYQSKRAILEASPIAKQDHSCACQMCEFPLRVAAVGAVCFPHCLCSPGRARFSATIILTTAVPFFPHLCHKSVLQQCKPITSYLMWVWQKDCCSLLL